MNRGKAEIHHKEDKAVISFVVVGVLLVSLLLVFLVPVHAFSPSVSNNAHNHTNGTTLAFALTVGAAGDTIVAAVLTISSVSATTSSIVSTLTDSAGSTFSRQVSNQASCIDNSPGITCITSQDGALDAELWTAQANAAGSDTVTVTVTTSASVSMILLDIANVNPTRVDGASGTCATIDHTCSSMITSSSNSFGSGTIEIAGSVAIPGSVSGGGTSYTYIVDGIGNAEYSSTVASPTFYPFSMSAAVSSLVDVGMVLSGAAPTTTTTATTTVNTACLGSCSSGSNGTSMYEPAPGVTTFNLHFYASQNLAAAAQIDNVTLKVAAVHITTNTGIFYVFVYVANGAPTAGNPYTLLTSVSVTLTNGTTNFFIHVNPQANLLASQYYAVGFMTTTTSSRGSGSSGSGVAIYETSQTGILEYKYVVGSSTLPNQFFSSTVQTPRDFIYIHSIYSVAIITTTQTSTLTGTLTATVTSTRITTQVVNQGDPSKVTFWYMPLFFLLFITAIFIGAYAMLSKTGIGN